MPVLVTSKFDDDSIKNERASMETTLLHMKTSDPLLYPHLDFLDFLNIKLGGG